MNTTPITPTELTIYRIIEDTVGRRDEVAAHFAGPVIPTPEAALAIFAEERGWDLAFVTATHYAR